jgi:hypothetical protein
MPSPKIGPPTPPLVFAKVSRPVVRALDAKDLLMASFRSLIPQPGIGPSIAFNSVEAYLDAAERQQHRIGRARAAILEDIHKDTPSRRHASGNLFNEVHFYLICWARIAKLARFIADKTRFRRVGLVLRRYHAELKERIDCRDHLEHFEERLPGGGKQDKLLAPNDLLNMINEHVTYGGRKLDVGPASIGLLRTIVAELRAAVLFDAAEALCTADPDRLSFMIQRAATVIQIAKVTGAVKKAWRHQDPRENQ